MSVLVTPLPGGPIDPRNTGALVHPFNGMHTASLEDRFFEGGDDEDDDDPTTEWTYDGSKINGCAYNNDIRAAKHLGVNETAASATDVSDAVTLLERALDDKDESACQAAASSLSTAMLDTMLTGLRCGMTATHHKVGTKHQLKALKRAVTLMSTVLPAASAIVEAATLIGRAAEKAQSHKWLRPATKRVQFDGVDGGAKDDGDGDDDNGSDDDFE
jgi:hypothetical protein